MCTHQNSASGNSPVVLTDHDHRQSLGLHISCNSFIDTSFIACLQNHDLSHTNQFREGKLTSLALMQLLQQQLPSPVVNGYHS